MLWVLGWTVPSTELKSHDKETVLKQVSLGLSLRLLLRSNRTSSMLRNGHSLVFLLGQP